MLSIGEITKQRQLIITILYDKFFIYRTVKT